ncbi:hypothetical protein AB3S75_024479 [Citrus x aurantiifolia]
MLIHFTDTILVTSRTGIYTSATFLCAFLNMVPAITFLLASPFGLEKVNKSSLAGRIGHSCVHWWSTEAVLLALYKGKLISHPRFQATNYDKTSHAEMVISSKKTERWTIGSIFFYHRLHCMVFVVAYAGENWQAISMSRL